MALPQQTFNTIPQLIAYVNTFFVPNGRKEIDGAEGNNILNSLGDFIVKYAVNADGGAQVFSSGGVVNLVKAINVVQSVAPTSITWSPNVQKEFYIVNPLAQPINLQGVTYYDNNFVQRTAIPGKSNIHIAQAENGQWIQVATAAPSDAPSGGGGNGQGNLF